MDTYIPVHRDINKLAVVVDVIPPGIPELLTFKDMEESGYNYRKQFLHKLVRATVELRLHHGNPYTYSCQLFTDPDITATFYADEIFILK